MASSRRLAVTGDVPWPEGGVRGMAVCPDGTVALATGWPEHRILRATLAADGGSCSLQVWAGDEEERGFADGPGEQARFDCPGGVAALRDGSLVVADSHNHRVRLVSPAGAVSTLAGSGQAGNADGPAAAASFHLPRGAAARRDGTVLIASFGHTLRAIAPGAAEVRTLAGHPTGPGFADGPAAAARFDWPDGVAVLPDGGALVCDYSNHRLRLLAADGSAVRTLAGSGEQASADGVGVAAAFCAPFSVAVDCAGTAIVADRIDNTAVIRRVATASGTVTTICGPAGNRLEFAGVAGAAIDARGRLLVADEDGLHVVADAGLAPSYFAQWTNLVWRPTRAAFRSLDPKAKAATRAVLQLAARAAAAEAAGRRRSRRHGQLLLGLPTLPLELWHLILGLLEPHALGGGAGR